MLYILNQVEVRIYTEHQMVLYLSLYQMHLNIQVDTTDYNGDNTR